MARAIESAQAFFRIFADDREFRRTIAGMQARMNSIAKSTAALGLKLGAIGAAIGAPLALSVRSFADTGDALDDLSKRSGVAASTLSYLAYAAQFSNVSVDQLGTALARLGRKFSSSGLPLDELLFRLADQMKATQDPAKRVALAMDQLGKSGVSMIPFLAQGRAEIVRLREEAEALGVVMTDQQAVLADELGDSWLKLKSVLQGIQNQIGAALAPTLIRVTEALSKMAATVSRLAKENPRLIQGLGALSVALTGIGIALPAFAGALVLVFTGISALADGTLFLITVFGTLLSPIGLISAALVAAGIHFTNFQAVSISALQGLYDRFVQIFNSMKSYLLSGDFEGAGRLAMTGLRLAWLEGLDYIGNKWSEWKTFIIQVMIELKNRVLQIWDDMQTYIALRITALSHNLLTPEGYKLAQEEIAILTEDAARRKKERDTEREKNTAENFDRDGREQGKLRAEIDDLREQLAAIVERTPYVGTAPSLSAPSIPDAVEAVEEAFSRNKGTFEGSRLGQQFLSGSVEEKQLEEIKKLNGLTIRQLRAIEKISVGAQYI